MTKINEWEDITTYSRGDKERIPTTHSINIAGRITLVVTCSHIDYKGEWIAICPPFLSRARLFVEKEDEAKSKAIRLIRQAAYDIQEALN